jgi:hypothetical protein
MLKNIKNLINWCRKDCRTIYKLWKRIVKQDQSNGDSEFIGTIGFGGKSSSFLKRNKRQSWKWGICGNYINPISEFDVGQMSFGKRKRTCKAQVVSTTRGGKVWNMDWWSLEKAHLQTMISTERDVIEY